MRIKVLSCHSRNEALVWLMPQWIPVTPEAGRIILGQKIPRESGATSSALGIVQYLAAHWWQMLLRKDPGSLFPVLHSHRPCHGLGLHKMME